MGGGEDPGEDSEHSPVQGGARVFNTVFFFDQVVTEKGGREETPSSVQMELCGTGVSQVSL